ncbi:MAG TPA: TonB-dependent receptor [Holophagaceae bacterium]|nr:TonB-dependent receptor [Holophagaceae bacterium]
MSTRRLLSLLPLAACSALTLSLAAQSTGVTTGDLKGVVRSTDGKALTQAKVTLVQDSTNQTRAVNPDANGIFTFRLLAPGTYTMEVEAPGYATRRIRDVVVRLGATQAMAVDMAALEASATVEVISENTLVDPTRTQASTNIDSNYINNLPINRRDFTSFSLTTPLVAEDNSPARQLGAAASSGLSFAGQSARQNNIMVDGLDNNDVSTGSTRTTFSQEAIQEFVVVPNGFSAEFGRAAGGTLNIITKSGGNDFSGDLFYFYRSGKYDAKRPLAGQETPFDQKQFGATVSGALKKDKLFYFVAVERFDKNDTNNITIAPKVVSDIKTVTGFTISEGLNPYNEHYTTGLIKLDWNQSDTSHWTARYSQADETNENQLPWSGLTDRSGGGSREIKDKVWSLSNVWNASSTFVNDLRVLGSLRDHSLNSLDDTRGPSVNMIGEATFGTQRFLPQLRTERNYEMVDTMTFFLGKHTLKFGADLIRTKVTGALPLQFGGVYRFQGFGPYADADAALTAVNPFGGQGLPVAFIQGFGEDSLDFKTDYYSAFLQDDWQITSTFALKLGVRYDMENLPAFLNAPDYSLIEQGGPYQLTSWSIGPLPGATDATVVPGGPYYAKDEFSVGRDWSSHRFSPRLAFNWQISERTRLYGGYGTFSGRTQLGPYAAVFLNNGTNLTTLVQSALEDRYAGFPSPWYTWATQPNHRYTSFTTAYGGKKNILLPGKSEMPETKQANLGFEFLPLPNLKFTLDGMYATGENFLNVRDVNAIIPNPAYNPALPQGPTNSPIRRPDARYSSIIRYDGSGESKYRSGTFAVAWQMKDSAALNFSYTWSKAEDNYIDWVTDFEPMNTFDPKAEMAPSNQDQRSRILLSAVFSTQHWQNAFFRNWTISFIGRFTSGRPYTIFTGVDNDYGYGLGNADGGAAPSDRPVGVGRNSETTPSVRNMDMRLARKFATGKKAGFEIMVDVFNVFNHYNVSQVQNVLAAGGYGEPVVQSNVDYNRQIQLGAKFTW